MNRFLLGIGWRMGGLVGSTWLAVWLYVVQGWPLAAWVVGLVQVWLVANLYRYVTGLNRKFGRFLEAVRYADFTTTFRAEQSLGPGFRTVNEQFNAVLDAFRQARAETETNLHYLNTIVQHVTVGLLSFDAQGRVELVNPTTLRLLGTYRLRQLSDLETDHPKLLQWLQSAGTGSTFVYQTDDDAAELSMRRTSVRLRGRLVTLVSLQNIRPELARKELEAWQNLTRVLRHEIMNSITPIVSLTGTMEQIIETDLAPGLPPDTTPETVTDALADLRLALTTISRRGQGVMKFVDAYRHFTTLPPPRLTDVAVEPLLNRVLQLVRANLPTKDIPRITLRPLPANLRVQADADQIEMVLLNLLRNAVESFSHWPDPAIWLDADTRSGYPVIRITDNGPGIDPAAIDKIFIPFFTTKSSGSGIGLSLSRQIMQQHGGQIVVESVVGQGSTFTLRFG